MRESCFYFLLGSDGNLGQVTESCNVRRSEALFFEFMVVEGYISVGKRNDVSQPVFLKLSEGFRGPVLIFVKQGKV